MPSKAFLTESLRLWESRRDRAVKDHARANRMVRRRKRQLEKLATVTTAVPRFVPLELSFRNLFGELGPELFCTGHHTAGPIDTSDEHAIRLCQQYHAQHAAKGWGGIAYHFNVARSGTILGLRPTLLKGAHTGGANSSNIGVMFHGTTGDHPTAAQRASFKWLLANAHTNAVPVAHRTDRDLRTATRRGHRDWPGHTTNACPGTHHQMILQGG